MTQPALTDTQLVLLSAAAQRDDLRIILPELLRGGAAQKVLVTLAGKGLIEPGRRTSHRSRSARRGRLVRRATGSRRIMESPGDAGSDCRVIPAPAVAENSN